ncbi:hypothetical protein [Thermodesulfovibrio hydrogeniphilus]
MGITYDEVWISTMREINICKDYIKQYEKEISQLKKELGITSENVENDSQQSCKAGCNCTKQMDEISLKKKLKKLQDLKIALEREKQRLKGLEELIK